MQTIYKVQIKHTVPNIQDSSNQRRPRKNRSMPLKHYYEAKTGIWLSSHFNSRLHNNGGGIVDSFSAQVEHCVVTLVFGFCYVLIYLLKQKHIYIRP